jgi:hypothetical protein
VARGVDGGGRLGSGAERRERDALRSDGNESQQQSGQLVVSCIIIALILRLLSARVV